MGTLFLRVVKINTILAAEAKGKLLPLAAKRGPYSQLHDHLPYPPRPLLSKDPREAQGQAQAHR
jgi:hypothetical protein